MNTDTPNECVRRYAQTIESTGERRELVVVIEGYDAPAVASDVEKCAEAALGWETPGALEIAASRIQRFMSEKGCDVSISRHARDTKILVQTNRHPEYQVMEP